MILCNSCNSKYLVNSAELKPSGRKVECSKCGNQWFQMPIIQEKVLLQPDLSKLDKINSKNNSIPVSNLPSTYVQNPKVSILNSILVIISIIILFLVFWMFKSLDSNSLILLKFYVNEFYFNLKLIIKDVTFVINKIIK